MGHTMFPTISTSIFDAKTMPDAFKHVPVFFVYNTEWGGELGRMGEGDGYSSSDPVLNAFAQRLRQGNVKFNVRRGLLRFGFHCYSSTDDVAAVLAALPP